MSHFMRRPVPQRFLAWLGRELAPHIPPRHSINVSHSTLIGDPDMTSPLIQVNEPPRDGITVEDWLSHWASKS